MVVSDNIAGGNRVTTGRQIPFCMLTAVIAHPTMPEGLISLFGNVPPISAFLTKLCVVCL